MTNLCGLVCGRAWQYRKKQEADMILRQLMLQAYAYLEDDKRALKALRRAKRSSEPDTAMDRLKKLLQERL